ncbi:hypothetical protein CKO36_13960 [Rhabdochromatium marinum]|nr:hypothetical protein [Rhabdochromatium marinum]
MAAPLALGGFAQGVFDARVQANSQYPDLEIWHRGSYRFSVKCHQSIAHLLPGSSLVLGLAFLHDDCGQLGGAF